MDLFKITKSKAREKILQLFFSNPDKKYYLREIEKLLDVPVGNVRRELLILSKSGLFLSEKLGKQVYYFLNKKSPIFTELKNIISKTIGAEAQIRDSLKKIGGIISAFIYGSFAKNKEDQLSDIDLMIIGNPDEDILIKKISSLEKNLDREVNYSIFSTDDFRNGLAKKEVFLEEIMANPKIFIIADQDVLEKIIGK